MDDECPVCTEPLDETDYLLASRLCRCQYSVCLWCYRRITEDAGKDGRPPLCPNCRTPYDVERIAKEGATLNPQQLEEVKRKKGKQEEKRKPGAAARPRKDLANVRVVQRNLVYVVGLPMELCYEDMLASTDYIGQYGKIVKISVSRTGPYGSSAAKNGPTGSAYITFKRMEDARRCIENIHSTVWEGKLVKACYGTTKYCNAFLKGLPCNNTDCLYLHDVAVEEDSYTKEETKSNKFVNLVHAASLNQATAVANGQPHATTLAELNAAFSAVDSEQSQGEGEGGGAGPSGGPSGLEEGDGGGQASWPALGGSGNGGGSGNAWIARAASSQPVQAVPLADDAEAWPGLPGGPSGNATGNPSSTENSENEGEAARGSGRQGATMADKIARASSTPAKKEEGKKKLTTLNGRAKQTGGEGHAEGPSTKATGTAETGQLSPPDTPNLPVAKPVTTTRSREATPSEPQDHLPPQHNHPPDSGAMAGGPAVAKAGAGVGMVGQQSQPAPELPLSVFKPPPGFGVPVASKAKVMPPPGFAHVSHEGGARLASPLESYGSEASSPGPAFASRYQPEQGPSSSQNIWGSSASLDIGSYPRHVHGSPAGYDFPQPAPRARSRFQFANEQTSPPHPSSHPQQQYPMYSQLSTPPPDYRVFGSMAGYQNGHAMGYQGYTPGFAYPGDGMQGGTEQNHQSRGEEGEPLPAGLALLRRLQQQAQGGLQSAHAQGTSTHASPSQHQQQHAIFQDPAILSATPSGDSGTLSERARSDAAQAAAAKPGVATPEHSPQPKTPNRRGRKGKGTG